MNNKRKMKKKEIKPCFLPLRNEEENNAYYRTVTLRNYIM
jgi:hypothetical protein